MAYTTSVFNEGVSAMKRSYLGLVIISLTALFLSACVSNSLKDQYAKYRSKTADQIFAQAELDLAKKHYTDAVESFEALDVIYPFGKHAKQAQLDVIYAYYKSGKFAESQAAAERYIRLYPRGQHTDYAYYMKGRIEYEQGINWLQKKFKQDPAKNNLNDKKRAFSTFNTLVNQYPNSPYTKDAKLRMVYLRNLFSQQELLVANYYFSKHAYVAAANRASIVVQHYPQTTAVESALVLLVKAYQQLNLNDQASNTLAILRASYPHSNALATLSVAR